MIDKTELERIEAAEKAAKDYIAKMPREQVEALGESQLLSDLTHEYLLHMPSASQWKKLQKARIKQK